MRLPIIAGPRWLRALAGTVAATTVGAGIVLGWDPSTDAVPGVRLHPGLAWVASNEVGQLTLLDGASGEVAAGVRVAARDTALSAVQEGTNGYALDRTRGSVVRVDAATLEATGSTAPVAGGRLAVFPTARVLYTLDTEHGRLARADPTTLRSLGKAYPLEVRTVPGGAVTDADGRLWVLDRRTGDLVWFAGDARHARAGAATPDGSLLAVTDGRPALVDPARRTMALLDPVTGAVEQSGTVGVRPGDTVAVSGSPSRRRLLISVSPRGLFLSCTFDARSCAEPVNLGSDARLGKAVEVDNHAVVPDYATGSVSVVDLASSRVVAQRRLFDHPVRFELLARDGVVFYNDPGSEHAGVIELDGQVRPIIKYQPESPPPEGPSDENVDAPADPTGPIDPNDPDNGDNGSGSRPDPRATAPVSIVVRPRDHGLVGDEFELTVVPSGTATITSAQWTFGDDTGAKGTTVRHRWDRPGTFPVRVTVRLRQGQVARAATRVVVESPDAPPHIVRLTVEPDAPRVDQPVRFGADLTGGQPQSWAWVVTGAGGPVVRSEAASFEYAFAAPGTYTATLTVSGGGASVEKSTQFTVLPAAQEVTCGATITTDAVLSADLLCLDDVALTIAASNVVLDLGGHTLFTDEPLAERKGVVVAATHTVENVTIRNGTISGFPTGIEMTDVSGLTIDNLTVSAWSEDPLQFGIVGDRAADVHIQGLTQSSFSPFNFGGGSTVTISGSNIGGNVGEGMSQCVGGSTCVVQASSIEGRWIGCFDDGAEGNSSLSLDSMSRISMEQLGLGCKSVSVTNSKMVAMLGGLLAASNTVINNDFYDNISMFSFGEVHILDNSFHNSSGLALQIEGSVRGEVAGNKFIASGFCGLLVSPSEGPHDHPFGPLRISGNEFISNGFGLDAGGDCRDGLRVDGMIPGDYVWISDNHSEGNKEHGFNVDPESVTDGMVVDGGRNTSVNDGEECLGIAC